MGKKSVAQIIISLILVFNMIINTGCESRDTGNKSVSGTGFYFDTVVSFTVYGTEDKQIINELMAECARYEKMFSPTDTESELYKLNHGEINEVSGDLYYCIQCALDYCELLDGRYDISIRPVSELWDFHSGSNIVPEKDTLKSALELVDYNGIKMQEISDDENDTDTTKETIDEKMSERRFEIILRDGMMLDLGSAAKGYVADRLCEYLSAKGYRSAIISLGGNIQCLGGKLGKDGKEEVFKVAVKSPFTDANIAKDSNADVSKTDGEVNAVYSDIVLVKDRAVVTSGIYERCFEKEGKLYHHILDANTGYPVDNGLASVTVICESGLGADILSTVLFIAGYDETLNMIGEMSKINGYRSFEAEFIYKDGTVKRTADFDEYTASK